MLDTQLTEYPVPRFRAVRLSAGLTQNDAAQRIGRTASALQKWETGANSPTMTDMYRLADVYGTTPASFFEPADPTALFCRVDKLERAVRAAIRGLESVIDDAPLAIDGQ